MSQEAIQKVHVISHTHWDREWYEDFQGYRLRLVYLIDELLHVMENDPNYRHFMMDGQTIVIDDYLEIRPENKERLLQLIQQGRIQVGPWYVMPDEFLVSGESLVRNFLVGYRKSRAWGAEPLKSGYVPDIFGHNSQFPQILQGFNMDNAVLFRGFYGDADPSEIWWEASDGSRVLGLKLDEDRSYGDFYFFIRYPFAARGYQYDTEELVTRTKHMLEYKSKRAATSVIAGWDGVDHIEIEPQLPWILKTLNEAGLGAEFIHSNMEQFLDEVRGQIKDLKVYKGEQRSPGFNGVNNVVVANVLSSRIHLKQRNHRCETLLERWSEPWSVFSALEGKAYPKQILYKSWEILLQNHPHDSICGCSIEQVHRDMIYRFDQSQLMAEHLLSEALHFMANHINIDSNEQLIFTLFNSTQTSVNRVVEVEIDFPSSGGSGITMPGSGGSSFKIWSWDRREIPYQLLEVNKGMVNKHRPYRDLPYAEVVDRYKVALPAEVPPFGYSVYTVEKIESKGPGIGEYDAPGMKAPVRYLGSQQKGMNKWDNGLFRISIHSNGSLSIYHHATGKLFDNLLVFEDEGDIGEGWNHVAPIHNKVVTSLGSTSTISVVYDGPLLTTLEIHTEMSIPARIDVKETKRSSEMVKLAATTFITLGKDDPVLHIRTQINNTGRDHRLKVVMPVGLDTDHYYTNTPFDLVKRNIQVPDYSNYMEHAREVVPYQGMLLMQDQEAGFALFSEGLYEIAVRNHLDDHPSVAMTLFRSTHKEVLSNGGDSGQILGMLEFKYAIRIFDPSVTDHAALWEEYAAFAGGIRSVNRPLSKRIIENPHNREVTLPKVMSFLEVQAIGWIVSAIKESEDRPQHYIIRLFNVLEQEVAGVLLFDRMVKQACLVNLDEQFIERVESVSNQVSLTIKPKQIVTLEVTFA